MRIKEELIRERLAEKFPGVAFKHIFWGMIKYKHQAIGVNKDGVFVLHLSLFRMRPKSARQIGVKDIKDVTYEASDLGKAHGVMNIVLESEAIQIQSHNLLGYDPLKEMSAAYEFLANKI